MIYGVGTDIVSIERIQEILNKNRDGFINRVLTEHVELYLQTRQIAQLFVRRGLQLKRPSLKL